MSCRSRIYPTSAGDGWGEGVPVYRGIATPHPAPSPMGEGADRARDPTTNYTNSFVGRDLLVAGQSDIFAPRAAVRAARAMCYMARSPREAEERRGKRVTPWLR